MLIKNFQFFFILAETLHLPESNTGSGLVGHSKIRMLTALSSDKRINTHYKDLIEEKESLCLHLFLYPTLLSLLLCSCTRATVFVLEKVCVSQSNSVKDCCFLMQTY